MNQTLKSPRLPGLAELAGVVLLSSGLAAQAQTFTNGLVAYWNFDQSTFKDSIGIHDGTALGVLPIPFVDGKAGFGKAIKLNGWSGLPGNQCVEIQAGDPDDLAFAGGSVSISAWFTVDRFDKSWQALVAKGESTNWRIARNGTSDNILYSGGVGEGPANTPNVNDGQWHNMVAVTDGTGASGWYTAIYVDGDVYSVQTSAATLIGNGLPMRIGDNPGSPGRTWAGNVDDVAIWNRVLTAAEVKQIYASGAGNSISTLIGPDTDKDGMPDAWEIKYGLNPNDPSDAAKDLNGNGISNLDEFKRGLDPTDTTNPQVVSAASDSSFSKVIVTFSKKLDPTTATNVANYAISPSLTVSNATLSANVVTLVTSPQTSGGTAYTVTATNVKDLNNWTLPTTNNKATFYSYLILKTGLNSGLQGYWNFETNLNDQVSTNNGVPHGVDAIPYVDSKAGLGKAIQLNGADQYVEVGSPNYFAYPNGAISVAAWFKVESFDVSWQALVAQGEGNSWRVARRGTDATPDGYGMMSYAGGLTDTPVSTNAANNGEWHHLVAVSDPSGANFGTALYFDGKLDVTVAGQAALAANGRRVAVGANPDASPLRYWNGEIDELAIWNRVLAANEITNLYSSGTAKPLSQLLTNTTDVPFPAEGQFITQSPGPNAGNVLMNTAIKIVHQDGKTAWYSTNVTMQLDGTPVTPKFTKAGDRLTLDYTPPALLTGGSKHTITLNHLDPGKNPTSTSWTFKTYGFAGVTKDKVASYPGSVLGSANWTADRGGATGQAGDYAIDLTPSAPLGGPVLVNDSAFLKALNTAATNDELSVSLWLKRYDIAASQAFWFSSPTQVRVYQAQIPWSDDIISFDTAGCCDTTTQRISQNINSFPGWTDDSFWTNWHLFTVSKKLDQKNIYIDGQLFLNGSNTGKLPTDINQFSIGSDNTILGGLMHGVVDDVAIYSKELTAANITALFGGTKPSALPSNVGLIAYWDFNDASKPLPTLTATYSGGKLTMTYTGTLVSSDKLVGGTWTAVPGASSPWQVTPSTSTSQIFYRAQQ